MVSGCSKCSLYRKDVSRCGKGYVNPRTIKDGLQGARMGLLKPCPYTHKGQRVLEKLKSEMETQ